VQRIERHDRRALRHFGFALAFMAALVFGVLAPWILGRPWQPWPFVAAGALLALAAVVPTALYPVYRALRPPLALLATVNNWVLLGVFYYLLLWPYGAYARLARRLHFKTGFDPTAPSYRIPRVDGGRRDGPTDLDQPF